MHTARWKCTCTLLTQKPPQLGYNQHSHCSRTTHKSPVTTPQHSLSKKQTSPTWIPCSRHTAEKALQEILKYNRAKFKIRFEAGPLLPHHTVQPYPPHGAPQMLFQGPWDNLSIQPSLAHLPLPSCLGWSHNKAAGSWFLSRIPAPSPSTGPPCAERSGAEEE